MTCVLPYDELELLQAVRVTLCCPALCCSCSICGCSIDATHQAREMSAEGRQREMQVNYDRSSCDHRVTFARQLSMRLMPLTHHPRIWYEWHELLEAQGRGQELSHLHGPVKIETARITTPCTANPHQAAPPAPSHTKDPKDVDADVIGGTGFAHLLSRTAAVRNVLQVTPPAPPPAATQLSASD
jgi:hypothetical protein